MRLQITLVLLIGITAALNSNFYDDPFGFFHDDAYSDDYYENFDATIVKSSKGMSNNIFFGKPMLMP